MPKAFVLINTEMGAENNVLSILKNIRDVKEVHVVYGEYDIIVKVNSETLERLRNVIKWNIRKVDKITSTRTLMVAGE